MIHCGAEAPQLSAVDGLHVTVETDRQLEGRFEHEGRAIQLSALGSSPLAGEVRIDIGALRYELHYDYEARQVVADGHGGALEYDDLRTLLEAIEALSARLQQGGQERALREDLLHERMLHASLGMLKESGGMPLERKSFDLGPSQEADGTVDKSLGDDGIRCIESGTTYYVSFDYAGTTILDTEIQAGSFECNGQCGPYCTQLQPWRMWTLDCLEHDTCCNATSDDACWTPLGECGDEYDDAMGDFLRGYAPFSRHCGG